jgi:hypothetical protein
MGRGGLLQRLVKLKGSMHTEALGASSYFSIRQQSEVYTVDVVEDLPGLGINLIAVLDVHPLCTEYRSVGKVGSALLVLSATQPLWCASLVLLHGEVLASISTDVSRFCPIGWDPLGR